MKFIISGFFDKKKPQEGLREIRDSRGVFAPDPNSNPIEQDGGNLN